MILTQKYHIIKSVNHKIHKYKTKRDKKNQYPIICILLLPRLCHDVICLGYILKMIKDIKMSSFDQQVTAKIKKTQIWGYI